MPRRSEPETGSGQIPVILGALPEGFKGGTGLQSPMLLARNAEITTIAASLQTMVRNLQSILDDASAVQGAYSLETVEVEAGITAEGQIGFLESHVGGNVHGTIKLVFQKRKPV